VVPGYFTTIVALKPSDEQAVKKIALVMGGGIGALMLLSCICTL
jgi:hypothetical protein